MTYSAIFLDMDHTLCDTGLADKLGLEDFQHILTADFKYSVALKIGEMYLKVIYGEKKNIPGWQKEANDTEIEYRAKLLKKTIAQEIEADLDWAKLVRYSNLFMELRVKHFSFFPETTAMLKRLRQNYTLILISNGPLFSQEPKIQKVAMDQYVDDIILGGALEHQKPHPSIFMLACNKAACRPSEAIHVGDRLDSDIQGSVNSGISSIWLNSAKEDFEPVPSPNYIINNIIELETLLVQVST